MKIKTQDLTGPALRWAVATCEGAVEQYREDGPYFWCGAPVIYERGHDVNYMPDRWWDHGGPIIEREGINTFRYNKLDLSEPDKWCGHKVVVRKDWSGEDYNAVLASEGPTPLVAAMRCYVASKLGDEVEIPDELVGAA